ncbi:MAG TPA: hypothetical protein VJ577_04295 [Burkholderiaceae bacterium]|nr:hypothetical protein [Burkholderiaceae bacterium]
MVLAVWIVVPGLAWPARDTLFFWIAVDVAGLCPGASQFAARLPAHLFVWSSRRILPLVAACKQSFSDHQTVDDGFCLQNQVE